MQNTKILVSAEQIQKRVQELARKISQDYAGRRLTIVCVLRGLSLYAYARTEKRQQASQPARADSVQAIAMVREA